MVIGFKIGHALKEAEEHDPYYIHKVFPNVFF